MLLELFGFVIINTNLAIKPYINNLEAQATSFNISTYRVTYSTSYSPFMPKFINGFCEEDTNNIVFNAYKWQKLDNNGRLWLSAHEWFHCGLHIKKHNNGVMAKYFPNYLLTTNIVKKQIQQEFINYKFSTNIKINESTNQTEK